MKTTKLRHTLKTMLMTSVVLISINASAQHTTCNEHYRPGLNFSTYVNGNGHGGFYNVSAVLNSHKNTFSFGPSWQKAQRKFVGGEFQYSYKVVGSNLSCGNETAEEYSSNEELLLFFTTKFYRKATLSTSTLEAEGRMADEAMQELKSLKLNTIESYVGIGYNYLITKNIKVRFFIALGVYGHLNFSAPTIHEKMAPVLMTGIGFGFIK